MSGQNSCLFPLLYWLYLGGKSHIKDAEMEYIVLANLGEVYCILAWEFHSPVDRIKDLDLEQVLAAAHLGLVTIIRIGTFKHAFSDQGVQTRPSQCGVWGYATPKKKVIHNQGLKGSFLKGLSPSKSITISQAILQKTVRECNDLLPSVASVLKWGHLQTIAASKWHLYDLCSWLM